MAKDVITRFKLETTGFDSKIKQAANELSAYSKTATQAKEGFNQFTKANVDAARALGTMATSTTNVKDKVKELVGAYNNAAKAYEALTKEQQQSDWAKALAGSLTQLQQCIKETKQEMQGLSSGGGLFSGDKLSGMLQVFGGNLMTKAAGAVANLGSEMAGMIKQGVELARQGEGIRIAFERLGSGDILQGLREATHGTVTDLELMKAAVKFNDFKLPVSELGTMLAFAQQKAKDTGQSVDYMVDSIVTGLGRKSLLILDNLGLSANEIKEKMKETGDMTKAVGEIIREQMAAAGEYVETAADRATQANVSLQNKMEELGRKFAPVEEASNQLWTSIKIGILDIIGGPLATLLNQLTEAGRMKNALNDMGGDDQVNKQLGKLRVSKAAGSGYMTRSLYSEQVEQYNRQINAANDYLSQYDHKHSSVNTVLMSASRQFGQKFDSISDLKAFRDAYLSMKNEYVKGAQEIMNASNASTGGTGGTGGTGDKNKNKNNNTKTEQTELQQNQAKINALTQEYVKLGDESTEAARERQAEIQKEIELLQQRNGLLGLRAEQAQGRLLGYAGDFDKNTKNVGGVGMLDQATNFGKIPSGGLQLSDKQMKAVNKSISGVSSMADGIDKSFTSAASAVSALGSAFASIEDPAAKVIGTVSQAIATVALGYATATAQAAAMGPWAWIAFAATGLATMISTISAIHSATGFANGGVIDSGHSPSFLSFSKAAPAFATGGIIPKKFATGGIIPKKFATGGIIPMFAGGGTIPASHAPTFVSFAKSAASRFASGGAVPHAAGGYFVEGSHYSGDVTPIMANAGELVLNKAQQGSLASQLQGGGINNLNLTATISGEQIRLALNNNGRRTGRGEYVTSKFNNL